MFDETLIHFETEGKEEKEIECFFVCFLIFGVDVVGGFAERKTERVCGV